MQIMYICETPDEVSFVFENLLEYEYTPFELNSCLNRFKENNIMYIFNEGDKYELCWEQDLKCKDCHQDCISDTTRVYVKQLIRQRKMERISK